MKMTVSDAIAIANALKNLVSAAKSTNAEHIDVSHMPILAAALKSYDATHAKLMAEIEKAQAEGR